MAQALWEDTPLELREEDEEDDADFEVDLDQMLADATWAEASQRYVHL